MRHKCSSLLLGGVSLFAGTNSLQALPLQNPSWALDVMENGTGKFRWGFDTANPPTGQAFIYLPGQGN